MKSQNIISIHLTRFKSVEDFQNLLDDNDIKNIDAKKLFEHKEAGYTKIFFDKTTFEAIAYVHKLSKKEITFQDDFKSFLKEMPSISFSNNDDSSSLDVDVILEKISERGVDSLSRKEKEFLDSLK
jgi:hypothetical protein